MELRLNFVYDSATDRMEVVTQSWKPNIKSRLFWVHGRWQVVSGKGYGAVVASMEEKRITIARLTIHLHRSIELCMILDSSFGSELIVEWRRNELFLAIRFIFPLMGSPALAPRDAKVRTFYCQPPHKIKKICELVVQHHYGGS
jgi:hypothetical protein